MSASGPLPPLPDLIPIAALRRGSIAGGGAMGEQRPRRPSGQPAVDLIDSARSRGPSAAPSQSRKASSSRHRKSDRRRDRNRTLANSSSSTGKHGPRYRGHHHHHQHTSQSPPPPQQQQPSSSSPERPANPRVNPIFVWVRQEDTRIVDVKCEDYDKRNRILLTKTAQGWRAIPRTETLVPGLKEAAEHHHHNQQQQPQPQQQQQQQQQLPELQEQQQHHHHHHHRNRKSRKGKVKRKSTAVQVDSDIPEDGCAEEEEAPGSPTWSSPVNIESHLPSHKIHVPRKRSPSPATPDVASVNSAVGDSAQTQIVKCGAGKICDVTPLDNLLAVAELEFNQQIRSGEWDKHPETTKEEEAADADRKEMKDFAAEMEDAQKDFIENIEQLNSLLESCAKSDEDAKIADDEFGAQHERGEDCDYTEDDDNNLAMDDILSRLEQSLRSPESTEVSETLNECDNSLENNNFEMKMEDELKEIECLSSDINENNYKIAPEYQGYFEEEKKEDEALQQEKPCGVEISRIELEDIEGLNFEETEVAATENTEDDVQVNNVHDTEIFQVPPVEEQEHEEKMHSSVDEMIPENIESPPSSPPSADDKSADNMIAHDTSQHSETPAAKILESNSEEFPEGIPEEEIPEELPEKNSEENSNELPEEILEELSEETADENVPGTTISSEEILENNSEDNVEDSEAIDETATNDDQPTDLSMKNQSIEYPPNNISYNTNESDEPTDLSVPKSITSPTRSSTPNRPPSQNSEAIQSPQPSGIPAVPPSPDIVSPTATSTSKSKSVFLESLLSATSQKLPQSTEVTLVRQKEPLDLGKCRKSASPTVSCSEEVKNSNNKDMSSDQEPPAKKFKSNDITLKTLLDVEALKRNGRKSPDKTASQETPRLLELLKSDTEPDPITQFRQLLKDTNLNIPDPMLVPKDKLSSIISNPGKEIPRLLKYRPELRLPEALAYPNLLQDPDILVITLHQLETIVQKQNQSLPLRDLKHHTEKNQERLNQKRNEKHNELVRDHASAKRRNIEDAITKAGAPQEPPSKGMSSMNELANDIDAATTAAFNQMMWLPYLNQLDAMSFGNNPEMMKMLNGSLPFYPGQMPDLSHIFGANRFPAPPLGFPMQPPLNYSNPLEMSMWQEAMIQANMLRPKAPFESLNPKNSFRDYLDKLNFGGSSKKAPSNNQAQKGVSSNASSGGKQNASNNFYHSHGNGSGHPYQGSYLSAASPYQSSGSKHSLQIPQYNPLYTSKSSSTGYQPQQQPQKMTGHSYYHKPHHHQQQKYESVCGFPGYHPSKIDDKQMNPGYHQRQQQEMACQQKPKLSCKSFASIAQHKQQQNDQHPAKEKSAADFSAKQQTSQPIDLSGSTTSSGSASSGGKLKVKQRIIDSASSTSRLLKHDDVAEVGSTTASIEEMQDAHKHLWHPLFGNQKGYSSPWNWTTVTATGE